MGTVAITDKLKNEVKLNVCKPFNARYQEAAKLTTDESKLIYETLFVTPAQVELMNALPNSWVNLSQTDNMRSQIYVAHAIAGKDDRRRHWLHLQMPANTPLYYSYAWTYAPPGTTTDSIELTHHSWLVYDMQVTCQNLLNRDPIAELERIVADRNQTLTTVMKMLDGCKTLNQVEKIWPAIRKYVDPDTVQRLDAKPKRVTAESAGIDQDALNALSVHHIRQQMTS